jgi:multidrug resistance efflux pump
MAFHGAFTASVWMKRDRLNPRGQATWIVLVFACALATIIGTIVFFRGHRSGDAENSILLHTVERRDFEAFVTEPGDVASSSNVEVRCRVKARGAPGTSILKICPEGTYVQAGDFLIQFDDSVLHNDLLAQKIAVANDEAILIQTKSNLENAKRTLREFGEGLNQQQIELLEAEVFVAEDEVRRSELAFDSSKRLFQRDIVTALQVESAQFLAEKAQKSLNAARRKLDVYRQFTREKTAGEFEADIKKQEANVQAATFTLELSKQRRTDIEEQIAHCLVKAPAAGQVVYANDRDGAGAPKVIEEGTLIRENQVVIRLPNLKSMQVDVKINESHINYVKPGQAAEILLDADPDTILRGTVKEIAPYPFPLRWHGAPLEYGVVVAIIDPPPTIRPGLRAKVKIVFESHPGVLQVPLAAVVEHRGNNFCLIRERDEWRPRAIQIASNNNTHVIVRGGVAEGEQVALTPFRHIKRSDLPDVKPSAAASGKDAQEHPTILESSAALRPSS